MGLGALLLTVAGLLIADLIFGARLNADMRILAGMAFVSLSPLVWITLYYRSSRRNRAGASPWPPLLFALGSLVAVAVTHPIFSSIIELELWLSRTNATNRFLAHILLNGFFHMFVLYALVRYLSWDHPSFDHRVHGLVLTLSACLGYATALNFFFIIDHEGLTILYGGLRLISQLCAFVAPALILGYFLGINRFEDMPFYYLSAGLLLSAVANGLLLYAGSELNYVGLSLTQTGFSPWPGFVASVLALVATGATIYGLLRRQNALARARLNPDL